MNSDSKDNCLVCFDYRETVIVLAHYVISICLGCESARCLIMKTVLSDKFETMVKWKISRF